MEEELKALEKGSKDAKNKEEQEEI